MSTSSADLQSTQSGPASTSSQSGMRKVVAAISNSLIAATEAIYQARKEEVRLRVYYRI